MIRLGPLFTDLYQLTMAEAYLASGKQNQTAVFELFFRSCPFKGEFAVLAGFDLVKEIIENFYFEEEDIRYLQSLPQFAHSQPHFFDALRSLDLSGIEIKAIAEGSLVFAREPLLQVRGPIFKAQLLETALLNSVNFATLIATYARRLRLVAGDRGLVEFGVRRAQGPNGAMTASRSAYLGGFDSTSHVLAGKQLGVPVVGTMAHSFVQSFWELKDELLEWNGKSIRELLKKAREDDRLHTHEGELAAFLSYAKTFPSSSLLLVDTYDTLRSGVPNAIRVFKVLRSLGHEPLGVRLDSGDLVYLSREARRLLDAAGFEKAKIFASNELDERVIGSIQDQGAQIDSYGVGTHLVTASDQPALGGVYKLVEVDGKPRMKISQQTEKLVMPAQKSLYRLYGKDGQMLLDLLTTKAEAPPQVGKEILALHPTDPFKKAVVIPSKVENILQPIVQDGKWLDSESLESKRRSSLEAMKALRADISRAHNPAPYKVSTTEVLADLVKQIFIQESPPAKII